MKGRLLLDVIVSQSAAIFELLTSENKTLLVRGNTFLILNLSFNVFDGVGRLNFKSNSLASQSLNEDLHTTTKAEHQVKGRLLLDVIVSQGAAIFELLTGENKTLLVRRDSCKVHEQCDWLEECSEWRKMK